MYNRIRNNYIFKRGAILERAVGNRRQLTRKCDINERITKAECAVADGNDGVGNGDLGDADAERIQRDRGKCVR